MRILFATVLAAVLLISIQRIEAQTVTTSTLVEELIDLQGLTTLTGPTFNSVQYSSYDRRSASPDLPGWFANSDGFGGEPVPGFEGVIRKPGTDGIGEYLICDVKGPGAIVRLWTAWFEGEVTLWLDQQKDPVYRGPAQDFFFHAWEAMLGEKPRPAWEGTIFQNTACYYPIPFAKGCRMEWKGDIRKLHFYHVQMRLYEPGTKVKTFTINDIRENTGRMDEVAGILASPSSSLDGGLAQAPQRVQWLRPGEKRLTHSLKGSGTIRRLAIYLTAKDLDKALRQTVLEVRFDGAPWGQVHSPVGDFFGVAPGINPYESLPFTVHPDGWMVCRFEMPYRDSAQVWVENFGDQEVTVTARILESPARWKEGESMHFRARWRVDHGLLADPAKVFDLPYLLFRGKGRMVGTAAYLMNPTSVPSSYGNWWGEGDEKIFIDNNLKASFIGTGSEDYFNYAWSSEELFMLPYCGQPRNDGPANRGFVTNYRWHILDNILFNQGFDFFMELYSHRVVRNFSYGRMIYLYAVPGGHDDHIPMSSADLRHLELPDYWWPEADGQAANSVFYQVEDLLAGQPAIELRRDPQWAAYDLAVWTPESMDDWLSLEIPVQRSGKYMLGFTVARMAASGLIRIELNGEPLKLNGNETHDLRTGHRDVSRNLTSGTLELTEGLHTITIRPAGEKAAPVGLDFIWVKKQ
ncbi:MAG: DUF2961 domain-containing protein [Bacteroidales bacterium]